MPSTVRHKCIFILYAKPGLNLKTHTVSETENRTSCLTTWCVVGGGGGASGLSALCPCAQPLSCAGGHRGGGGDASLRPLAGVHRSGGSVPPPFAVQHKVGKPVPVPCAGAHRGGEPFLPPCARVCGAGAPTSRPALAWARVGNPSPSPPGAGVHGVGRAFLKGGGGGPRGVGGWGCGGTPPLRRP